MRVEIRTYLAFFVLCLSRVGSGWAGVDVIDAHAGYPEGPLWDQGRLLYVEYAANDIKAWDGKELKIYWRKEHCGPTALIHFRGEHILVACYDGNYLLELDAHGIAGEQVRSHVALVIVLAFVRIGFGRERGSIDGSR